MTPLEISNARRRLALVGRTRASVPFFYCAGGADGFPLLMVDERRISPGDIARVTRAARIKVFVGGVIERTADDGSLIFRVDTDQLAEFMGDLRGLLDEQIPGLRNARIGTIDSFSVGGEAAPEPSGEVAASDPDAARYLKLHTQVAKAQQKLPKQGRAKDLERLEVLHRRTKRYLDRKLWLKLARLTPAVEGLSPGELEAMLEQVGRLIEQARG